MSETLHPLHAFFESLVEEMNGHAQLKQLDLNFKLGTVSERGVNQFAAVIHRNKLLHKEGQSRYGNLVEQLIREKWLAEQMAEKHGELATVNGGPPSSLLERRTPPGFENHRILSSFMVKIEPKRPARK